MRRERSLTIADTKRYLQELHDLGMTNETISLRLGVTIRTIQNWWNDVVPYGRHFYRLQRVRESIDERKEEERKYQRWLIDEHNKREAKINRSEIAKLIEQGVPQDDPQIKALFRRNFKSKDHLV